MKILSGFILLFCLTFSSIGFAQSYYSKMCKGLTDLQCSELIVQAEKMKNVDYASEANKWIETGSKIGLGITGAAKEIGVATNELVQTPIGKLTAGVLVYKFIGRDLVKTFLGTFFFIFGSIGLAYFFKRIIPSKVFIVEYHENGKKKRKYNENPQLTEGANFMIIIGIVAFFILGAISCSIAL